MQEQAPIELIQDPTQLPRMYGTDNVLIGLASGYINTESVNKLMDLMETGQRNARGNLLFPPEFLKN